jgi:hypothetical protein
MDTWSVDEQRAICTRTASIPAYRCYIQSSSTIFISYALGFCRMR